MRFFVLVSGVIVMISLEQITKYFKFRNGV